MRTILIPTDFTVDSLMAVKKALHVNEGDKTKIILFHCINLSDSITDLLTFSKGRTLKELSSQVFSDACEIIRNKFTQTLDSLQVELFTGNTHASFDNFIEANDVDVICFIDQFSYKKTAKNSIDFMHFLQNSTVPVLKMEVEINTSAISKNQLAALFS